MPEPSLNLEQFTKLLTAKLTEKQATALPEVTWFLYGPRGAGRSYVAACTAILTAYRLPGMTIELIDHRQVHQGEDYFLLLARQIVGRLPKEFQPQFSFVRRGGTWYVTYTLKARP